jgi:hypothetical protein
MVVFVKVVIMKAAEKGKKVMVWLLREVFTFFFFLPLFFLLYFPWVIRALIYRRLNGCMGSFPTLDPNPFTLYDW